jgi:hypothetical protein
MTRVNHNFFKNYDKSRQWSNQAGYSWVILTSYIGYVTKQITD